MYKIIAKYFSLSFGVTPVISNAANLTRCTDTIPDSSGARMTKITQYSTQLW